MTLSAEVSRKTMINDFSIELATGFVQSTEDYPVDFDRLWKWCGYSRKDSAKRVLLEMLEQGIDYQSTELRTGVGGTPKQQLSLTIDASKQFAMMAKTQKGKEVRRYFLDCEKVVKAIAQSQYTKAPAKILNRNYAASQKECRDQLKRHGADGRAYSITERYNNQLSGIESGHRNEVTPEQANQLNCNYLMGAIELLKRDLGFNDGCQYHLANTVKKSMRHGMYENLGIDSVPEALKPKKERKILEAK